MPGGAAGMPHRISRRNVSWAEDDVSKAHQAAVATSAAATAAGSIPEDSSVHGALPPGAHEQRLIEQQLMSSISSAINSHSDAMSPANSSRADSGILSPSVFSQVGSGVSAGSSGVGSGAVSNRSSVYEGGDGALFARADDITRARFRGASPHAGGYPGGGYPQAYPLGGGSIGPPIPGDWEGGNRGPPHGGQDPMYSGGAGVMYGATASPMAGYPGAGSAREFGGGSSAYSSGQSSRSNSFIRTGSRPSSRHESFTSVQGPWAGQGGAYPQHNMLNGSGSASFMAGQYAAGYAPHPHQAVSSAFAGQMPLLPPVSAPSPSSSFNQLPSHSPASSRGTPTQQQTLQGAGGNTANQNALSRQSSPLSSHTPLGSGSQRDTPSCPGVLAGAAVVPPSPSNSSRSLGSHRSQGTLSCGTSDNQEQHVMAAEQQQQPMQATPLAGQQPHGLHRLHRVHSQEDAIDPVTGAPLYDSSVYAMHQPQGGVMGAPQLPGSYYQQEGSSPMSGGDSYTPGGGGPNVAAMATPWPAHQRQSYLAFGARPPQPPGGMGGAPGLWGAQPAPAAPQAQQQQLQPPRAFSRSNVSFGRWYEGTGSTSFRGGHIPAAAQLYHLGDGGGSGNWQPPADYYMLRAPTAPDAAQYYGFPAPRHTGSSVRNTGSSGGASLGSDGHVSHRRSNSWHDFLQHQPPPLEARPRLRRSRSFQEWEMGPSSRQYDAAGAGVPPAVLPAGMSYDHPSNSDRPRLRRSRSYQEWEMRTPAWS